MKKESVLFSEYLYKADTILEQTVYNMTLSSGQIDSIRYFKGLCKYISC